MRRSDVIRIRKAQLEKEGYKRIEYSDYDSIREILQKIMYIYRAGKSKSKNKKSYSDCLIMADTETSKNIRLEDGNENHVVMWTITIRAFNLNLITIWGRNPQSFSECLFRLSQDIPGDILQLYFHNLSYDWVFLRRHLIRQFGIPSNQLNTKPQYPIYVEWEDSGIIIRDSLILAQRSLEKWSDDLDVEHKKAVGYWDYNIYRGQNYNYSEDELHYAEFDTLAGVECLQSTMDVLHKHVYSLPMTATGIPREELRHRAKEFNAHEHFLRQCLTYEQYQIATMLYHGGYTHGNRHCIGWVYEAEARDFASSYPYRMLVDRYPVSKFISIDPISINEIMESVDDRAFMIRLHLINVRLKDDSIPMPFLQYSKTLASVDEILDNGRILCAKYVEIYLNEIDLSIILEQYDFDSYSISHLEVAEKGYLPEWFTDYIYDCFVQKTLLKGGDPVAYSLAKAKLNSLYGMCVQKSLRDSFVEDYETGEYTLQSESSEEDYEKYLNKWTSILPYQWGVWVTAYASRALFDLGKCVDYENGGEWLYCDTDSIYATKWNEKLLDKFNENVKKRLTDRGFKPVNFKGKDYYLGVAELDGDYSEFKTLGAKRYCCRDRKSGKLKITVAGVPKRGSECLHDDINNFAKGFIFDGKTTKKLLHKIIVDDIHVDSEGNEIGDSIDLSPCDYLLDQVHLKDWESIFYGEEEIREYEE